MKKSFRIIAIIAAVALVIGAIPVAFALSNVNYKKSWANPLPLVLIPDSSYPIIVRNGIDNYNRIYLSDTLQSQRLMLEYGKTHGGIIIGDGYQEEGDHPLDFTVSPATMEAYGLTKATLKQYVRQFHYSRNEMTQFSYDGGDWTDVWDFDQNNEILPLKDISIAFADSFDLYPKDSWYNHIGNNRLEAYVVGNPTFNFFLTNGPELYNTDYAPADGILYDAAITKGAAEDDLEVYFRVQEEVILDEDDEPIGYEDEHDLGAEAPREITVTGIDNDYSDTEAIIPIAIPDTNDQINYFISADYLNTLDTGIYYFEFAFEKGTSVFILQVNEAPCDGGTDCPCNDFTDLNSSAWYHKAVDFAIENKLMSGTGNQKFSPAFTGTRAQFVQILWNLSSRPLATGEHPFTDVPEDAWYADAVAWAYEEGVISGTSATTFAPDMILTREQVAAILYNFDRSLGGETVTMDYDLLNMFPDNAEISSWARDAMLWACNEEIINGKENHYQEIILDPLSSITRMEIAQIMRVYLS